LLAAARRVFAEKGLGEATARDIVRETDLATGTFYNYFRDVRDATLSIRRDRSLTIEQRVERGGRAFFDVVAEEPELFCVLRRNAGAVAMLPAENLFPAGMDEFSADLDQWSEEGGLPGVDLDYLSAAIAGAAMQVAGRMVERDPPDPAGATRFMTTMVLAAIQTLASAPLG